jgi:hypothetical protein
MNKLKITVAAFILCICTSVFAQQHVGVVIKTQGEVKAQSSEAGLRDLERGDHFYVTDIVSTGPGGMASLRFIDGTIVELMGMTDYRIEEYNYNESRPGEDSFSAELLKGGLRTISGKIGERNPESIKIETQTVTLTLRGTDVLAACDGGCAWDGGNIPPEYQYNYGESPFAGEQGNLNVDGFSQPNSELVFSPETGMADLSQRQDVIVGVYQGSIFAYNMNTGVVEVLDAAGLVSAARATPSGTIPMDEITQEDLARALGEVNVTVMQLGAPASIGGAVGGGSGGGSDCDAWNAVNTAPSGVQ